MTKPRYDKRHEERILPVPSTTPRSASVLTAPVLAVILLVIFGLLAKNWLVGIALGLIFVIVGVIFYRRDK